MIFIFGYGYTAKHLSSKVSDKEIIATSRSLNSLQINQKRRSNRRNKNGFNEE